MLEPGSGPLSPPPPPPFAPATIIRVGTTVTVTQRRSHGSRLCFGLTRICLAFIALNTLRRHISWETAATTWPSVQSYMPVVRHRLRVTNQVFRLATTSSCYPRPQAATEPRAPPRRALSDSSCALRPGCGLPVTARVVSLAPSANNHQHPQPFPTTTPTWPSHPSPPQMAPQQPIGDTVTERGTRDVTGAGT